MSLQCSRYAGIEQCFNPPPVPPRFRLSTFFPGERFCKAGFFEAALFGTTVRNQSGAEVRDRGLVSARESYIMRLSDGAARLGDVLAAEPVESQQALSIVEVVLVVAAD